MSTRRAARYADRGQVECGFRVINGHYAGLVEGWRHGVATLMPNDIVFVPTVGAVRFLKRRPVRIAVQSVNRAYQRQPDGWEIIAVNALAQVVQVTTPTATLEWAVLGDRLLWAIDRVTSAP
jgi:hypothetical protein